MENVKRNSFFSPIIVLVCIALVASFLLAAVYQMTEPVIAAREAETKNATLKLVLPEGDSFEVLDTELVTGVTEVSKAGNNAGYVISTNCKSTQGGEISMMIGINSSGQIIGISVLSHNETAGIGDKVLQESYFKKYYNLATESEIQGVDTVSGATKTSSCVKESCKAAIEQYSSISK